MLPYLILPHPTSPHLLTARRREDGLHISFNVRIRPMPSIRPVHESSAPADHPRRSPFSGGAVHLAGGGCGFHPVPYKFESRRDALGRSTRLARSTVQLTLCRGLFSSRLPSSVQVRSRRKRSIVLGSFLATREDSREDTEAVLSPWTQTVSGSFATTAGRACGRSRPVRRDPECCSGDGIRRALRGVARDLCTVWLNGCRPMG